MTICSATSTAPGTHKGRIDRARRFGPAAVLSFNQPDFQAIVSRVIARFFAQRFHAPPGDAELQAFGARLWHLIEERGLPVPLSANELGSPGGMTDAECAQMVAQLTVGLEGALWADTGRQLVKACFYPEFKVCRDSFREVTRDGTCRRQELDRVRTRISGTHCVDCPHWVALSPERHSAYLTEEWRGEPATLSACRDIFLPEDFRRLRVWLHAAARSGHQRG